MRRRSCGSEIREPELRGRAPGLSLFEMLVVLVLVGILAVLAVPRLRGSGLDEAVFAGTLRDALHLARRQASASRCEVQVAIGTDGYTMRRRTSLCSGAFSAAVQTGALEDGGLAGTRPAGVSLSATPSTFYFDAAGRVVATPGGPAQDVAISIGSRQIELIGATGHVRAL